MSPTRALPRAEFIALMAMLSATIAFSIDSMLPALPEIGDELSAGSLNRAQLILTSFVLGLGLGTFIVGPLSDRYGRRPVMLGGAALYSLAAAAAWWAPTLETMLVARVVMGMGGAGPRIVAVAVMRDLYSGREMARILSFIMIVFSIVPAIAPALGAILIYYFDWRAIFLSFIIFSAISALWLYLRLPETLAPEARRPASARALWHAAKEVMAHPTTRTATFVTTLGFGMIFSVLSSTQPIFDVTFGRADSFPIWYAFIAIAAASSGFLNAKLVARHGMRPLIKGMLIVQIVISGGMIALYLAGLRGDLLFAYYIFWTISVFFQAGMTFGNLNALAMEPMGHIAGMAASIISGIATIGGAMIAAPIGLAFDGTPLPNAVGLFVCSALALWLTLKIKRESDED